RAATRTAPAGHRRIDPTHGGGERSNQFVTAQQYHDGSKHHFHRFAPALGYLDWASQPNPFRSFDVPAILLSHSCPGAARVTYDGLFEPPVAAAALSAAAIGDVLRHALGLSAWKRF